jgi:hypothetical protein
VICGRKLWLTALGRARRSASGTTHKHSIKAIDRLVGSKHLHAERKQIYAGLVAHLLDKSVHPTIVVDGVDFQDHLGHAALVARSTVEPFLFTRWSANMLASKIGRPFDDFSTTSQRCYQQAASQFSSEMLGLRLPGFPQLKRGDGTTSDASGIAHSFTSTENG